MAIAKATCTCATCGQQFEVRVVKYNSREARSFEKWAEENITECRDCESKRIAAEHEVENAKATETAKNSGWPELKGTQKQIAWAETCRANMIKTVCEFYDDFFDTDEQNEYARKIVSEILLTKTEASWWIENRGASVRSIIRLANQIDAAKMEAAVEAIKSGNIPAEEKAEEKKEEPEQKQERPTAIPENQKHSGCADIRIDGGKVTVAYDRDETFRGIVKGMGFTWDSGWVLKLDETTGTAENVCAELGSKLLNAGFSVRFDTQEIMDAAVSGDYTPHHMRWIWSRKAGGFYAEWGERSDILYKEIMSIPGAKYSAPGVVIPERSWDALADYAEKHDFRFTAKAKALMESLAGSTSVVAPEKVKKPEYQEKNVLETSREVLADLRDD